MGDAFPKDGVRGTLRSMYFGSAQVSLPRVDGGGEYPDDVEVRVVREDVWQEVVATLRSIAREEDYDAAQVAADQLERLRDP